MAALRAQRVRQATERLAAGPRWQDGGFVLIDGGVELAVVSRPLGHTDLSTTADVYGGWTRDMQARVAAKMDEVLATSG